MLEAFLSYLILFGLKNNIILANGSGALQFQREKMYRKFRYINALLLVVGIIVVGMLHYVLSTYIYSKFDLEIIGFTVIVLISGLYHLIVAAIWRNSSKFNYYLYETSHSYAFDLIYTISVVLMMDLNTSIIYFVFEILAIVIVILVMNVIVGFFVRSMNRGYMNVNFRNIASRLFLLGIVSILIYYASLLVA